MDAAEPDGDGRSRWADVIGRLIVIGHRLEDIRCYTLPQIDLYLEAAARQERLQLVQRAIAARAGGMTAADFAHWMERTAPE